MTPTDDLDGLCVVWTPFTDDECRASSPSATSRLLIALVAFGVLAGASFGMWWLMKGFTEAMEGLMSGPT